MVNPPYLPSCKLTHLDGWKKTTSCRLVFFWGNRSSLKHTFFCMFYSLPRRKYVQMFHSPPNIFFPTFEPRQREDHLGQQRLLWTPNLFRGPGGSSFRIAEVDQSQSTQRADRKVVPQVVNATSWTPKKNDGFCWWFLSELSMG